MFLVVFERSSNPMSSSVGWISCWCYLLPLCVVSLALATKSWRKDSTVLKTFGWSDGPARLTVQFVTSFLCSLSFF